MSEAKERLALLRKLLEDGEASTQEELREKLKKQGYDVNQSTVSRMLKRLGAIKAVDEEGVTVYRHAPEEIAPMSVQTAISDLVTDLTHNGSIIVVRTTPGSASLVARHLDHYKPGGILGTIAGDDTIFVAPPAVSQIGKAVREIRESFH
jgi:transcriptional regulator of arginine metabolism